MYRLRIHSLDAGHDPAAEPAVEPEAGGAPSAIESSPSSSSASALSAEAAAITTARNPNPRVVEIRGVVHLYRINTPRPSPDPVPLLPVNRGTLLFVLAIPSSLLVEDLLRFCSTFHAKHFLEIRVIRNDGIDDRYSALIQLDDQNSADNFYHNLNGWPFPSAQEEVCHILFMASVEYTESTDIVGTPLPGSTELPTCPVCLERLDQDTSGIVTTDCDHSFHCSCISKWANSSCLVCRFCQEHSDKPTCFLCGTSENLWICMICSFIGCGRYKEGHAIRHWKDTQHCYILDLATQQVWDYVGDTYVHRLNLSKGDGKLVKSKHGCRSADGSCGTCECSEDSDTGGALFSSKLEAIVDEYNNLLETQLENQRQYYESLIIEAKGKREKLVSESVEKALSLRLQNIQLEIEKTIKENKVLGDMNEKLMKDQKLLRDKLKEIEEREKTTLRLKDEKIRDLEEEIRDITVYIQAQKALGNVADADIREGTILPIPQQKPSQTSGRRTSKNNRKR